MFVCQQPRVRPRSCETDEERARFRGIGGVGRGRHRARRQEGQRVGPLSVIFGAEPGSTALDVGVSEMRRTRALVSAPSSAERVLRRGWRAIFAMAGSLSGGLPAHAGRINQTRRGALAPPVGADAGQERKGPAKNGGVAEPVRSCAPRVPSSGPWLIIPAVVGGEVYSTALQQRRGVSRHGASRARPTTHAPGCHLSLPPRLGGPELSLLAALDPPWVETPKKMYGGRYEFVRGIIVGRERRSSTGAKGPWCLYHEITRDPPKITRVTQGGVVVVFGG